MVVVVVVVVAAAVVVVTARFLAVVEGCLCVCARALVRAWGDLGGELAGQDGALHGPQVLLPPPKRQSPGRRLGRRLGR